MGEGREGGFTPDKPPSLGAPGSTSDGTGRPGVGLEKRCGRTPGGGMRSSVFRPGKSAHDPDRNSTQRLLFRNSCSLEISCYLVTWR